MKYYKEGCIALVILIGMFIAIPTSSPYVSLGGDSVAPTKARAGDTVAITRNFSVRRRENVFIYRRMVSGDCAKNCELIDLTSGTLILEPGTYPNLVRNHVIPANVHLGMWRFEFELQWHDIFWGTMHEALSPLTIEIVK